MCKWRRCVYYDTLSNDHRGANDAVSHYHIASNDAGANNDCSTGVAYRVAIIR